MMRMALNVACIAGMLVGAVRGSGTEPPPQAKATIAQCIDGEGDEYIEARNWLIEHPEALDFLGEDSWKERWVKKICEAWMRHRDLYERAMKIQNYLTQPFFTAEGFTGRKGEYVPLDKTIADCRRILAGDFDKKPAEEFYMMGGIA